MAATYLQEDAMPTTPYITPDRRLTLDSILGMCQEFKRHHGAWPRVTASADDFAAAGVQGVSGADIERALRTQSNGLAEDPDFAEMRSLVFLRGGWDVNISFIDPECCKRMPDEHVAGLVDSLHLEGSPQGRALDGATSTIWADLPLEAGWRTGHSARVPVTDELIAYIGLSDMIYGNDTATIRERYYLQVIPNGRLYMKYSTILGSGYVGTISPEKLEGLRQRLIGQAEDIRAGVGAAPSAKQAAPAPVALTIAQELALMTVVDGKLQLPKQQLAHYDDISRLIGKAGGRYVTGRKQFVFDAGIDCTDVLHRLVAGDTVNFKQQYQFFATPEAKAIEAAKEVEKTLGTLRGKRVLEPSAGSGSIANVARRMGADVVAIEAWNVNAIKLRAQGYDVIERDFLSVTPEEIGTFDAILANPPYTKNQDIQHAMHMFQFIRPGGALSIIMSTAWLEGKTKVHAQFKEVLVSQDVTVTQIEVGAFKESGTPVPTVRLDFREVNVPRAAEDFLYESAPEAGVEEEEFALAMQ
jgi:methylase of polypeptide subunit release factors